MMFSHLPEDVQYICSLCSEKSPAQWECIIQETMQHGFQRVMLALQHSKCAQHLLGPMAAKQGIEKLKVCFSCVEKTLIILTCVLFIINTYLTFTYLVSVNII